jgi:hypothetical protein
MKRLLAGLFILSVPLIPHWREPGSTSNFNAYSVPANDGSYTIQAMATDNAGNIGYSSEPHTVIIAKNTEKIYLLSPPNGASVSAPFVLSWEPYGGLVYYYLLQFSSSPTFAPSVTGNAFVYGSSTTIDTMAPGTYY